MSIETLGYPSRMAAIAAMDKQGKTPAEMAEAIGVGLLTARTYRSIARRQERIRRRRLVDQQFRQAIWFDRRVVDALRPAADARRVPVTELVRDLICTIAEDQLVTAVLADEADQS